MIKRLLSLGVVVCLICCVCATSAMGRSGPETAEPPAKSAPRVKSEATSKEKLRTDISRLTADAKAGKISPRNPSPFQPRQSNSLSKGAKIAIGVGIGALIFGIIMWRALHDPDS